MPCRFRRFGNVVSFYLAQKHLPRPLKTLTSPKTGRLLEKTLYDAAPPSLIDHGTFPVIPYLKNTTLLKTGFTRIIDVPDVFKKLFAAEWPGPVPGADKPTENKPESLPDFLLNKNKKPNEFKKL